MLAAPAGYGKTTLARQWGARHECPVVWYRTNRASGDVALLAVQFDELFASLAPTLPREPGKVAAIAAANPSPKPLGRALVSTFEAITPDVLVIVDEWEAAVTPESDELLSTIVTGIPARFVVTTRDRPKWFTPRLKLYGEGLEIGVDELRMTDAEAAQVLDAAGAVSGRTRLMRTAGGWPAVLGLAAMSGEADLGSIDLASQALDEFLTTELLASTKPETQDALMLLAVSAIVDCGRADQLLGEDAAIDAVGDGAARGLVAVTERTGLFFHPLLRDLLIRRFTEMDLEQRAPLLARCRRLIDRGLWDEALSVAEHSVDPAYITDAIAAALDDLLAAGRTSSLDRWVAAARTARAEGGRIDYAEAELRLRQGNFQQSIALGGCAGVALTGNLAARAHLVAARAALLASYASVRDKHLAAAGALVTQPRTEAELRWLRFAASIEDELPEASELADELSRVDYHGHNHVLRVATAHLQRGMVVGPLPERIAAAEASAGLVDRASDPYASTSMLNMFAYALFATGRYKEALAAADRERAIAEEFELPFVIPYAEANRSWALGALREFAEARRALSLVGNRARVGSDPYLASQHTLQSAALALGRGDLVRAIEHLAREDPPRASTGGKGERQALRALVLSALNRADEADGHIRKALRHSRSVEVRGLVAACSAIRSAARGDAPGCVGAYEEIADAGVVWGLVLAWRARYEVAAMLLGNDEHRDAVLGLLLEANDAAIARRAGISVPRLADRGLDLTAREQEVCELLAQGRTNQEIATTLVISISTAKVHVQHILEKLGVRSRVDAARLWEENAASIGY